MTTTLLDPDNTAWTPSARTKTLAAQFFVVCLFFLSLALTLFVARIWTRTSARHRLAADDWIAAVAFVCGTTHAAFFLVTIKDLDDEGNTKSQLEQSHFYSVISQPFWAWAMAATKCSIAITLLRLEQGRRLRKFLWAMIVLQIALAVYNMLAQLLQCIPLQETWNLHRDSTGKCWSSTAYKASAISVQMCNAVTDWVFAILPISFLRKVQRPLRERVIIGVLMALGVIAGAASLSKIGPIVRLGHRKGDYMEEYMRIGIWNVIEELLAFSCTCVPVLRIPFTRILEYVGLVSSHSASQYGRAYGPMATAAYIKPKTAKRTQHNNLAVSSVIRMTGLSKADARSEEHILASAADGGVDGIWCTTEVRLEQDSVKSVEIARTGEVVDANWLSVDVTDVRRAGDCSDESGGQDSHSRHGPI